MMEIDNTLDLELLVWVWWLPTRPRRTVDSCRQNVDRADQHAFELGSRLLELIKQCLS